MRTILRPVLLVTVGLGQLACAEGIAPRASARDLDLVVPGVERMRASFSYDDGTRLTDDTGGEPHVGTEPAPTEPAGAAPEPTGEMPSEFQTPPSITRYSTDVGFKDTVAWAQAFMEYFGSHAEQTVKLDVYFNNSRVANVDRVRATAEFFPWTRTLWTSADVSTSKRCGQIAQASGVHKAWHQWPLTSWSTWGNTTESSRKDKAQPPCEGSGDGDGGAGGGGTIVYVCYCRDYYNELTGEWEHGGIIYCLEA